MRNTKIQLNGKLISTENLENNTKFQIRSWVIEKCTTPGKALLWHQSILNMYGWGVTLKKILILWPLFFPTTDNQGRFTMLTIRKPSVTLFVKKLLTKKGLEKIFKQYPFKTDQCFVNLMKFYFTKRLYLFLLDFSLGFFFAKTKTL